MAHGFVLSMGGFCYTEIESISPSPSSSSTVLSDRVASSIAVESSILELRDLDSPDLEKKLEEVSAETIEDKSKGDALSKTFSILQISWFIVQCLTRALQHLPITLLEVTALAFAGLSIITYCLWWNKPLNVKYHISLDGSDSRTFRLTPETDHVRCPWITRVALGVRFFFVFGLAHIIMAEEDDDIGHYTLGKGTFRFSSGSQDQQWTRLVILIGVGSLFGAFHCAAWSFSFPSHTEMVLWRFSSLAVLIAIFAVGYFGTEEQDLQKLTFKIPRIFPCSWTESKAGIVFRVVFFLVSAVAYIVARIMLIVLAVIQLRSLPPISLPYCTMDHLHTSHIASVNLRFPYRP